MGIDGKVYRANADTVVKNAAGDVIGSGDFSAINEGDEVDVDGNVYTVTKNLQDDRDAAKEFDDLVETTIDQDKIDDLTVDPKAVEAAREAYDDLTPAQQALVKESNLKKLEDAEAAVAKAEANAKVDVMSIQSLADRWSIEIDFADELENLESLKISIYEGTKVLATNEATAKVFKLPGDVVTSPFYTTGSHTESHTDEYWSFGNVLAGNADKVVAEFVIGGETFVVESTTLGK